MRPGTKLMSDMQRQGRRKSLRPKRQSGRSGSCRRIMQEPASGNKVAQIGRSGLVDLQPWANLSAGSTVGIGCADRHG